MEAAAAAMPGTSGGGNTGRGGDEKKAACDVEALRKCLKENKGDRVKCQAHIDAFRSSCSASDSDSGRRPGPAGQVQIKEEA